MDKTSFSLSDDFKKQYSTRKEEHENIDKTIRKFQKTFDCVIESNLWFKKIKFYLKIKDSTEVIHVIALSPTKVIFRRFE